jgi:hypothetical protein
MGIIALPMRMGKRLFAGTGGNWLGGLRSLAQRVAYCYTVLDDSAL